MKRLLIMLTVLVSLVLAACQIPDETTSYSYAKEYWGEWLRMDTGEKWYISGGSITIDGRESSKTPALAKQSSRVVEVREDGRTYYLYASRVANASFTGRVEAFDQSPLPHSAAGGRAAAGGKGWIDVVVKDLDNGSSTTVKTDGDGKFTVPESIPGDDYQVTPQGGTPVVVTPVSDGDDVGTITISDGVNFKTSIKPRDAHTDMAALYAGETYNMTITVENTGTIDCLAATYQLDGASSINSSPILGTIEPGKKKEIPVSVQYAQTQNEYDYKKIGVIITDNISGKEWHDSVSLKIYKEKAAFNIRADSPISGVVIAPTGQAYAFNRVTSATLTMPRSSKDYLAVFSGATAGTEAVYSLGIDVQPESGFGSFSALGNYEPNDTEDTAVSIAARRSIMSYLHKNDIDYYRASFNPAVIDGFATKEAANGDGNDTVSRRETHYLDIRVKNHVNEEIQITSAVLAPLSVYAWPEAAGGRASIGSLNAGHYTTLTSSGSALTASDAPLLDPSGLQKAFQFKVSADCPPDTDVPFTVTFTDSRGHSWTETLSIKVEDIGPRIAINTPVTGSFTVKETADGGDNKANPGETLYLDIRFKNTGSSPAPGVNAVLTAASSYVTIDKGTAAIGDLSDGHYKTLTSGSSSSSASYTTLMYTSGLANAFKFTVLPNCPEGTEIPFTVTFTGSGGNSWTDTLTIQSVGTGANIAINTPASSNVAVKEAANGNGNNQANPGETHYLDIRVTNSGSTALGVNAVLTTASSHVTIDKGAAEIGDLRAGYYKTLTYSSSASYSSSVSLMYTSGLAKAFKFIISPSCPAGTSIPFTVTFTDFWGNTWTDTLLVWVN